MKTGNLWKNELKELCIKIDTTWRPRVNNISIIWQTELTRGFEPARFRKVYIIFIQEALRLQTRWSSWYLNYQACFRKSDLSQFYWSFFDRVQNIYDWYTHNYLIKLFYIWPLFSKDKLHPVCAPKADETRLIECYFLFNYDLLFL